MQIAPTATPFNAQITTVEDVAEIDLGANGMGRRQPTPHPNRRITTDELTARPLGAAVEASVRRLRPARRPTAFKVAW
jgi:hypothetical protein